MKLLGAPLGMVWHLPLLFVGSMSSQVPWEKE